MQPNVGMHFEDVRKRLRRMNSTDKQGKVKDKGLYKNLKTSLLNQSRLCDGDGAVKELVQEIDGNNHSLPRVGYSSRYERSWERIFGKA